MRILLIILAEIAKLQILIVGSTGSTAPCNSTICGYGGAFFYGERCYKLMTSNSWSAEQCSGAANNFASNPQTHLPWGRMAVFTDPNMYQTITKQIAGTVTDGLWLGAKSTINNGSVLSDYCWMNNQTSAGSQVSTKNIPVTITAQSTEKSPYCLYANPAGSNSLYAEGCTTGQHSYICEFGCGDASSPVPVVSCGVGGNTNSQCGAGLCDFTGSAPTTTVKASTTSTSTLKSPTPTSTTSSTKLTSSSSTALPVTTSTPGIMISSTSSSTASAGSSRLTSTAISRPPTTVAVSSTPPPGSTTSAPCSPTGGLPCPVTSTATTRGSSSIMQTSYSSAASIVTSSSSSSLPTILTPASLVSSTTISIPSVASVNGSSSKPTTLTPALSVSSSTVASALLATSASGSTPNPSSSTISSSNSSANASTSATAATAQSSTTIQASSTQSFVPTVNSSPMTSITQLSAGTTRTSVSPAPQAATTLNSAPTVSTTPAPISTVTSTPSAISLAPVISSIAATQSNIMAPTTLACGPTGSPCPASTTVSVTLVTTAPTPATLMTSSASASSALTTISTVAFTSASAAPSSSTITQFSPPSSTSNSLASSPIVNGSSVASIATLSSNAQSSPVTPSKLYAPSSIIPLETTTSQPITVPSFSIPYSTASLQKLVSSSSSSVAAQRASITIQPAVIASSSEVSQNTTTSLFSFLTSQLDTSPLSAASGLNYTSPSVTPITSTASTVLGSIVLSNTVSSSLRPTPTQAVSTSFAMSASPTGMAPLRPSQSSSPSSQNLLSSTSPFMTSVSAGTSRSAATALFSTAGPSARAVISSISTKMQSTSSQAPFSTAEATPTGSQALCPGIAGPQPCSSSAVVTVINVLATGDAMSNTQSPLMNAHSLATAPTVLSELSILSNTETPEGLTTALENGYVSYSTSASLVQRETTSNVSSSDMPIETTTYIQVLPGNNASSTTHSISGSPEAGTTSIPELLEVAFETATTTTIETASDTVDGLIIGRSTRAAGSLSTTAIADSALTAMPSLLQSTLSQLTDVITASAAESAAETDTSAILTAISVVASNTVLTDTLPMSGLITTSVSESSQPSFQTTVSVQGDMATSDTLVPTGTVLQTLTKTSPLNASTVIDLVAAILETSTALPIGTSAMAETATAAISTARDAIDTVFDSSTDGMITVPNDATANNIMLETTSITDRLTAGVPAITTSAIETFPLTTSQTGISESTNTQKSTATTMQGSSLASETKKPSSSDQLTAATSRLTPASQIFISDASDVSDSRTDFHIDNGEFPTPTATFPDKAAARLETTGSTELENANRHNDPLSRNQLGSNPSDLTFSLRSVTVSTSQNTIDPGTTVKSPNSLLAAESFSDGSAAPYQQIDPIKGTEVSVPSTMKVNPDVSSNAADSVAALLFGGVATSLASNSRQIEVGTFSSPKASRTTISTFTEESPVPSLNRGTSQANLSDPTSTSSLSTASLFSDGRLSAFYKQDFANRFAFTEPPNINDAVGPIDRSRQLKSFETTAPTPHDFRAVTNKRSGKNVLASLPNQSMTSVYPEQISVAAYLDISKIQTSTDSRILTENSQISFVGLSQTSVRPHHATRTDHLATVRDNTGSVPMGATMDMNHSPEPGITKDRDGTNPVNASHETTLGVAQIANTLLTAEPGRPNNGSAPRSMQQGLLASSSSAFPINVASIFTAQPPQQQQFDAQAMSSLSVISPSASLIETQPVSLMVKSTDHPIPTGSEISNVGTITSGLPIHAERSPDSAATVISCQPLEWEPFSPCGATCGENLVRVRIRRYAQRSATNDSAFDCQPDEKETELCDVPKCPPLNSIEALVTDISMKIGCCWLLASLSASVIASAIKRSKEYLAVVHVNFDISQVLAHSLVIIFASRNDDKFSRDVCRMAAVGMQYFFLVSFSFQLMEALFIHSVLTFVNPGSKPMIGLKMTMALCWGVPLIVTAVTTATSYKRLMSDFSCWLNVADDVYLGTFLPVLAMACPTVILLEAAGAEIRGPSSNVVTSCRIARGSLILVFGGTFASWFLGSSAIYSQNVSLCVIVMGINISLGICAFFYHLLADDKVRQFVKNTWRRVSRKYR